MNKNKTASHEKSHFRLALGLFIRAFFVVAIIVIIGVAAINIYVITYSGKYIITEDEAAKIDAAAIVVLGASVRNGEPSDILSERLDEGLNLFSKGASNILLLTGDNGKREYNEVQGMKNYVLKNGKSAGLTDENIYLDYAGFSTYDSMYRLSAVFECKNAIVSTQRYHLYRALYIANKLGIKTYGVAAEDKTAHSFMRNIREIPARVKDFFFVYYKVSSVYGGEPVPLTYPSTQAG